MYLCIPSCLGTWAQSGYYTALLISRSWAEPSVEYTLLNTLREKNNNAGRDGFLCDMLLFPFQVPETRKMET